MLAKARFDEEETEGEAPPAVEPAAATAPETLAVETRSKLEYPGTPGAFSQFRILLARRWKIFFRDRGQLWLQIALLFGFPMLVVIFALDGLPQIKSPEGIVSGNLYEQAAKSADRAPGNDEDGEPGSGLIMFQVVLLALMGSNNAAREIAGERLIFEKEKFAGVRPSAYVASKAVFLGVLVLAQAGWMAVFVDYVVQFKGDPLTQMLVLVLVDAALTAVCLALLVMKTAEQASLVSILSGRISICRFPGRGARAAQGPQRDDATFIASYWGWSGFIQTMHREPASTMPW